MLPEVYCADEHKTPMLLFFDLMPVFRDAYRSDDQSKLLRIFAFAEWCARHPNKDIWNAAGVAFYEHLFDHGEAPERILPWISAETYADVRGLFAWRLGAQAADNIENAMRLRKKVYSPHVRALIEETTARLK
jgi:hypothetical protein